MHDATIHRLHHVNIKAPGELLLQCRDFYRDVLGLEEGERPPFSSHGYWLYADAQAIVHLTENASRSAPGGATTFDHFALACSGIDGFEARLAILGVEFERREVPGTSDVQLFLHDPAGVRIELNFAPQDA